MHESIELQMSLLLTVALAGHLLSGLVRQPAMVIALLALNRGIIKQPAYVALVLMSLITTLVVPILLRNWLYRP